jgi:hypothetical protein
MDYTVLYGQTMNDVWWTVDGVEWTQATLNAAWRPRHDHTTVAFDGSLWVLGGRTLEGGGWIKLEEQLSDVWRSNDGVNWIQVTEAAWPARSMHSTVVLGGSLWTMGGSLANGNEAHDIWYFPPPQFSIFSGHAPWYRVGEPLNLQVTATGLIGTADYQWYKDGVSLGGETTATYHVAAVALADAGSYTCQVLDSAKALYTAGPVQIVVAEKVPVAGPLALLTATAAIAALMARKRCRG